MVPSRLPSGEDRARDPKPSAITPEKSPASVSMTQKYVEEMRVTLQQRLDGIERHIFVRRPDLTLVVRPLTVYHVNEYIVDFLEPLYRVRGIRVPALLKIIQAKYPLSEGEVLQRYHALLDDISALVRQDYASVKNTAVRPLQGIKDLLPTMGEIAITEVCNNRCRFCYMGLDTEYAPRKPLAPEEFKVIIDRIWFEAQAPSLNFTGGEPTLSRDLPDLLQHAAGLGFKTVVITNGRRLADDAYLGELIAAGVNGFQVSIEAADATTHDGMVGMDGAWAETVQGIKNCKARMKTDAVTGSPEFWVSTNTTISKINRDVLHLLPAFVKEIGAKSMSANMIIWSGLALKHAAAIGTYYTDIGPSIRQLRASAEEAGIKFTWLSPTGYCFFNPVIEGYGYKGCSCCGGMVAVDCQGWVIPCSSTPPNWGRVGNLVTTPFKDVWGSELAWKFRNKEYAPDACKTKCADYDVCGGACPLYWHFVGTKELDEELARVGGTFK